MGPAALTYAFHPLRHLVRMARQDRLTMSLPQPLGPGRTGGLPRRSPLRTGHAAVPPLVFEVLQELPDQGRVEIGEAEPAGRPPGLVLRERQQEPARVAVGADRVRAGLLLPGQPVGEEPLQDRGEVSHRAVSLPARAAPLPGRGARGRPGGTSRWTSGRRGRARWTAAGAGPARPRRRGTSPAWSRR